MQHIRLHEDCDRGICADCPDCALPTCHFGGLGRLDIARDCRTLARGERLESGGGCMAFWIVLSGTAASCTCLSDGRRQILSLETPGATICGGMAGFETPSWLEALSACEVCVLDLSPYADLLRSDPDFMAAVFQIVHARLARSEDHLATLGRLDSRERVTLFLARFAHAAPRTPVSLPMSREDIADYLGLNSETVSRVLSKLRKLGLVTFLTPTDYVVPDMEALARRLPVPIGHGTGGRLT